MALRVLRSFHPFSTRNHPLCLAKSAARFHHVSEPCAARVAAHVPRVHRLHGHNLAHDGTQRHSGWKTWHATHSQQVQRGSSLTIGAPRLVRRTPPWTWCLRVGFVGALLSLWFVRS
jgi:hypothetical protein